MTTSLASWFDICDLKIDHPLKEEIRKFFLEKVNSKDFELLCGSYPAPEGSRKVITTRWLAPLVSTGAGHAYWRDGVYLGQRYWYDQTGYLGPYKLEKHIGAASEKDVVVAWKAGKKTEAMKMLKRILHSRVFDGGLLDFLLARDEILIVNDFPFTGYTN